MEKLHFFLFRISVLLRCVAAVKSTQYSHRDKPGCLSERTLEMEGETFLQPLVLEVERQNVSTVT